MEKCSEDCELLFEKLFMKLVGYNKVTPSVVDQAKLEYSFCISTIEKVNIDEFPHFKKETDRLDSFSLELHWGKQSLR